MFRKAVGGRNRGGGGLWKKRRERGDTEHRRCSPGPGARPALWGHSQSSHHPPAQDSGRGFSGSDHARGSSRNLGGHHVPGARFQQRSFCSFLSPRGHRRLVFPGSKEPPPWDGWGSWDLPALGDKSRLCVPQDVELCFSLKVLGKDGPSLP